MLNTLVNGLVGPLVTDTFKFPLCRCFWTVTERRDDIVVADMVADMDVDTILTIFHNPTPPAKMVSEKDQVDPDKRSSLALEQLWTLVC